MEKWSHITLRFFKKVLTVNIVNCLWSIWAIVSGFLFLVLIITKFNYFVSILFKNGNNFCSSVGNIIRDTFMNENFLSILLSLEIILAGILGLGWITTKIFYIIIDKIQETFFYKKETLQ